MIEYPTREAFLHALPKGGHLAEVGVLRGVNSKNILNICNPTKLVLVDPWAMPIKKLPYKWARMQQSDLDSMYRGVVNLFKEFPQVEIIRDYSVEAAKLFSDQYFDWVYIDGSHQYSDVFADLEAWLPKIKEGGMLCGHDYDNTSIAKNKGDGVYDAVNDFCSKYNFNIISVSKKPTDAERDFCIQI